MGLPAWLRPCEKCSRPIVKTSYTRTCSDCYELPEWWVND